MLLCIPSLCFTSPFTYFLSVFLQLNDRIYQLTGLVFDELSPVTKGVLIPFMYVSKHVMFGYSVVPFALLRWRRTKVVRFHLEVKR